MKKTITTFEGKLIFQDSKILKDFKDFTFEGALMALYDIYESICNELSKTEPLQERKDITEICHLAINKRDSFRELSVSLKENREIYIKEEIIEVKNDTKHCIKETRSLDYTGEASLCDLLVFMWILLESLASGETEEERFIQMNVIIESLRDYKK